MRVSLSEAKGQLTEGHPAVRLVPITGVPDTNSRRALLAAVRAAASAKATKGPDAARSQDFLYGDDGLPG